MSCYRKEEFQINVRNIFVLHENHNKYKYV